MADGSVVYFSNLPQPRQIDYGRLKADLSLLCSRFGPVLDVRVSKHIHQRGQAWVTFTSADTAHTVVSRLPGLDAWGVNRPVKVALARTASDAAVAASSSDAAFDEHKRHRLAERGEKHDELKARFARKVADKAKNGTQAGARPAAGVAASNQALPDAFVPPNKILYFKDVPDDYEEEDIISLASRYNGFKEVRFIESLHVAFIEFDNEHNASVAKDGLSTVSVDGVPIKIFFQRA